ncbi:hypothetical protein [Paractinoplanes rishiriensis]|uniref:Guanylate cyclase domain-containing protein n=1 Tax=Paractinoplanes rishiriensis TaxID=1050105 RepID=A0A919K100_9ACTN|nr:hypothetical protein [Actinoplanes rishiriensis]GIE94631.1 hypothetical protein Ari01nite_20960 [Actinoplanes rishiriensis]
MRQKALFHTILATDVAKSGSRNDNLLLRMRADLRRILGDTLSEQGIDLASRTVLDDGDGFRVLLPAGIPPHALLDPFLSGLGIELRQHREASSTTNRLRLRVGLHIGLLHAEQGGSYTGQPLVDLARLLDAPAGRALLDDNPGADLVVLLTDVFYQEVVAGGMSLDPAWFGRIPVQVKETDRLAWAYLPGIPPVAPASPAAKPSPPAPPGGGESTTNVVGLQNNIGMIIGRDRHG